MGLDQYAYAAKKGIIEAPVDFNLPMESDDVNCFFTWLKQFWLQEWMENLYAERGGVNAFNSTPVLLNEKDLLSLKHDCEYYNEFSDENEEIIRFVHEAQSLIKDGYDIVYDSWW